MLGADGVDESAESVSNDLLRLHSQGTKEIVSTLAVPQGGAVRAANLSQANVLRGCKLQLVSIVRERCQDKTHA